MFSKLKEENLNLLKKIESLENSVKKEKKINGIKDVSKSIENKKMIGKDDKSVKKEDKNFGEKDLARLKEENEKILKKIKAIEKGENKLENTFQNPYSKKKLNEKDNNISKITQNIKKM
jgi:hypothetical protein